MKGLHQGERLLLLVNRSGISKNEVAKQLSIKPGHLSRLFKSEILTTKIKKAASALFSVDISYFDFNEVDYSGDTEPPPTYTDLEQMSALEVMRYLEEKDNRHYQERSRLLAIIENLTKK